MGYWGAAPWDNDNAADWLAGVFAETKLHEVIERCLKRPIDDENHDEIRAAIMLFISLGRIYIYDGDTYEEHLQLCLDKLDELKQFWSDGGWDEDLEWKKWLDYERQILQHRQDSLGVPPDKRTPWPRDLVEWWANWLD